MTRLKKAMSEKHISLYVSMGKLIFPLDNKFDFVLSLSQHPSPHERNSYPKITNQ